jgi:hypothetical protein
LTQAANLPPVSRTPAVPVANLLPFNKFDTGVVDTGGAPLIVNIFANF